MNINRSSTRLILVAGLSVLAARAVAQSPDTATYETESVRRIVARAADGNRLPLTLKSYAALVHTEIGVILAARDGGEFTFGEEQLASRVRWVAPDEFSQTIVGYRMQAAVPQASALSYLNRPWLMPTLYGIWLETVLPGGTAKSPSRRTAAVHPLADDRDRFYRFSGGDTVVVLRVAGRNIPIIRVRAKPRADLGEQITAFRGELLIDASLGVLAGLRGELVRKAPRGTLGRLAETAGVTGIALILAENQEVDGAYWLPAYQRIDLYASWAAGTDSKAVVRLISRFRDYAVNDTEAATAGNEGGSGISGRTLRLVDGDSLRQFRGWAAPVGELLGGADPHAFDDVVPQSWRPTGRALTRFRVTRVADAFHFNRVEGVFTGWGVERRFRDEAPGLTLRANAGWAWADAGLRGSVEAVRQRGAAGAWMRAARRLENTNDFRAPVDSGGMMAALFGLDEYDYVDRMELTAGWARRAAGESPGFRFDAGVVRDAGAVRHIGKGPLAADSAFRENRGVMPGKYLRLRAGVARRPVVPAALMVSGLSAEVAGEGGLGELEYLRVDARFSVRHVRGPFSITARADVAALAGGSPPAQQLIELGFREGLAAYRYKQFAGNRAALVRSTLLYRLPFATNPIRFGQVSIPPPGPTLALDSSIGWSELDGAGSRAASALLATPAPPATAGWRGSAAVGVRFFGGSVGFALARSFDGTHPWKVRVVLASLY